MIDIIIDTLVDSIKLFPFLLLAFLIIEIIEHRFTKKSRNLITKSGKFGPFIGSLLGAFPQCGFSVLATNLYTTRIITLGTLISVYLSTSDEMLPILISENAKPQIIIKILGIKILIAIIVGFIIDFFFEKQKEQTKPNYDICEEEHCNCKKNILKSSLIHTIKTLLFITIITFILNLLLANVDEKTLSKIFMKNNIIGPFISSLIGLVPNCASSVMLTELYLHNAISLSSAIAGLLTGSGVGILMLFKSNKNIKDNLKIILLLYLIGAFSGLLIEILGNII